MLRLYAGSILQVASPPVIMAVSGILSATALYWLGSSAAGILILVAFTIYAVGQTYYWPCILGFVAERFPKGGALTLNTVSAMGLLSLGMFGNPILGVAQDKSIYKQAQENTPELAAATTKDSPFLWMTNDVIDTNKFSQFGADNIKGHGAEVVAAITSVASTDAELNEKFTALETSDDLNVKAVELYSFTKANASGNEELEKSLESSIPAGAKAGLASYDNAVSQHGEMKAKSGRDVLKFAAIFPAILVIAFGFIAIYFKTRGGYKPVELNED